MAERKLLKLSVPGAEALLRAAGDLSEHIFGPDVSLSPRLPRVEKGKERRALEGGLVCGTYRRGITPGALWVGRYSRGLCGVAVTSNGTVVGLYVQFGRGWVRRGREFEGRRLDALLASLPRTPLPSGLREAVLRGARLILDVLGPDLDLLPERRVDLSPRRLPALLSLRPVPGREDLPFEAEIWPKRGSPSGFSIEVRGIDGRVVEPALLCVTPWNSLLWRGRLKPGWWAAVVAGPGGRRLSVPVQVLPAPVRRAVLYVKGLRTILDASRIRRALEGVPGVGRVEFDLKGGRVEVRAVPGAVLVPAELRERIEALGYKVERVEALK